MTRPFFNFGLFVQCAAYKEAQVRSEVAAPWGDLDLGSKRPDPRPSSAKSWRARTRNSSHAVYFCLSPRSKDRDVTARCSTPPSMPRLYSVNLTG